MIRTRGRRRVASRLRSTRRGAVPTKTRGSTLLRSYGCTVRVQPIRRAHAVAVLLARPRRLIRLGRRRRPVCARICRRRSARSRPIAWRPPRRRLSARVRRRGRGRGASTLTRRLLCGRGKRGAARQAELARRLIDCSAPGALDHLKLRCASIAALATGGKPRREGFPMPAGDSADFVGAEQASRVHPHPRQSPATSPAKLSWAGHSASDAQTNSGGLTPK